MDFDVVEVERDKRQKNVEGHCAGCRNQVPKLIDSSTEGARNQGVECNDKPYVGMEFNSERVAMNYYDAYAGRMGFSVYAGHYSRTKPDGSIVSWEFMCSKDVLDQKNVETCNAMLCIERKDAEGWVVTKFIEGHNHSLGPTNVHYVRPDNHFAGPTKNVLETSDNQHDFLVSVERNHVLSEPLVAKHSSAVETNQTVNVESSTQMNPIKWISSTVEVNRLSGNTIPVMPLHFQHPGKRTLGQNAHNLLNYFSKKQVESPGFYSAIQLDSDNRLSNIVWADARSRTAYSHFGDTVIFDTMYRPNQFQVPLASFTGVNNHGQMILFGCALLMDESEASFVWVFKTWLSSMNNRPPVSITTDQDRAIKAAVHQVLPETRHCICKWHILREGQERLARTYLDHPSFYGEFYFCINFSETIEDFESSWSSILDKYNLQKNDWLQAVYNAREQWAPVYFRNTFFAALSSNHGVGSFFDGYLNQQTTIPLFFRQYEKAFENSLEREIDADYDTICTTPVLKTPSPMEQQAANLYTKKIFSKFQDELVETFVYTANKIDGDGTVSRFRVVKYEHEHKEYIVTLDVSEMAARCSCLMFEYSGILCRHILTVFTVTNVLTIPLRYVMKRWTRNARGVLSDEQETIQSIDSLTLRFNSLCHEALKFSEEGSATIETFSVAMECLREGARKIAMVKKNFASNKPPIPLCFGSFDDNGSRKQSISISDAIPSLWPWQDSMQSHVDAGVTVMDLNQPTKACVAINHDGALTDNTVVLTCFKSMKWVIENKDPESKVAVINLKLHDYCKAPSGETEVQFRLTRVTLEPMMKSMSNISQQLLTPSNKVAVINLKLQDTKTNTGEAEVKFRASRDTLFSMLRSLAYIREKL